MADNKSTADDEGSSDEQGDADETETALLPKSFFQGKDLEVGNKCEVKIESLYEDEVEVSYVPHKKKSKDSNDDDADKPTRHQSRDDSDLMRESMYRMDAMAQPAPAPGGY